MLTLKARLVGLYKANDFKQEDGSVIQGKTKLQLQTTQTMNDGSSKLITMDISIPPEKVSMYKSQVGKDVSVDVGVIGKVTYYGI